MPRASDAGQTQPEQDPRPNERPPGYFVSDQLQSDTSRFLEEVKSVVERRLAAGLGRER